MIMFELLGLIFMVGILTTLIEHILRRRNKYEEPAIRYTPPLVAPNPGWYLREERKPNKLKVSKLKQVDEIFHQLKLGCLVSSHVSDSFVKNNVYQIDEMKLVEAKMSIMRLLQEKSKFILVDAQCDTCGWEIGSVIPKLLSSETW